MSKSIRSIRYLDRHTDEEKWELLKESEIKSVLPVIESLEQLSQNETLENISSFKEIEQEHLEVIHELDSSDRHVLEEAINKELFQAYRSIFNNYTRWMFTIERAEDIGIESKIDRVNKVIIKAQDIMDDFSSQGDVEFYSEELSEVLTELDEVWDSEFDGMDAELSTCWYTFFKENVERKRNVIVRHMNHFSDNAFGKWLENIRAEREWSLAKAEKHTGVSASYIHRMEKGRRGVPSFGKLRELASGYDVPFETVIAMATDGVKEIDEFMEDGIFEINGQDVSPKLQYDLAEMIRSLKTDDMVSAHQKLDEIARQIHD